MIEMWPRLRTVLFWAHLTIGVAAGLPILVMCVTGTLLTYQIQLQAWIDHLAIHSRPTFPGTQALSLEDLMAITHRNRGVDPITITVFREAAAPVGVELNRAAEPLYLDAYTGSVIGGPSKKAREFFRAVTAWHRGLSPRGPHWPQFRVVARAVNSVALITAILGILIWLPRRWTWSHLRGIALFRWSLAGRARDFNWHNALGVWSVIPLLVIFWTGTAMSYEWARRLTEFIWGTSNTESRRVDRLGSRDRPPNQDAAGLSKVRASSMDDLLARAKEQCAEWKAITIFVPKQESDAVHFTIDMSGYDGFGKVAVLALDRSGKVSSYTPAGYTPSGSGAITPSAFIRFGHTGEAWGVTGQTVAGLSSLGGVMLVWTGIALSLRRLRSWRARSNPLTKWITASNGSS
jgi:uncharacterized iron-regulated membrane protein